MNFTELLDGLKEILLANHEHEGPKLSAAVALIETYRLELEA